MARRPHHPSPKKVGRNRSPVKKQGFWETFGLADFAMSGRTAGISSGDGRELLAPGGYTKKTPEQYDTRSFKAKKVVKSGKINPKDTSTW